MHLLVLTVQDSTRTVNQLVLAVGSALINYLVSLVTSFNSSAEL